MNVVFIHRGSGLISLRFSAFLRRSYREFNNADTSRVSVNDTKPLRSLIVATNISKDFLHPPVEIYGREYLIIC